MMIEFRHKEWIRESVFEGLEKRIADIFSTKVKIVNNKGKHLIFSDNGVKYFM